MKKNAIVITAIVILIFFVLTMVLPFIPVNAAKNMQQLQQDLNKANKQMDQIEKGMKQTQEEKKDTKETMQKLAENINRIDGSINEISNEISALNQTIAVIEQDLAKAKEDYNNQRQLFLTRIRVMYEEGNTTYLDVILNAKSISDLQNKVGIVKEIVEYDTKLIEELEKKKDNITALKKEQDIQKAKSEAAKQQTVEKKEDLAGAQKAQEEYMKQLETRLDEYEKQYNALEKLAEQTQKNIQQLQAASNRKFTGGKFGLPASGYTRISSDFGMRFHPVLKTNKLHTGVDFPAPTGTAVLASNDGVVILSKSYGGYGNCIIIDHGSGIATLYGHNSSLLVKEGDSVKRGQVIAKSGNTGFSTGPHIHFEVIVNGKAVDPKPYIFGK